MRYLFLSLAMAFFSLPASASPIEQDKSAARILAYYGIGQNASPATSVTLEQFYSHMQQLKNDDYNVVALPDVVEAYKRKEPLPRNSVVITFDGSEKSTLTHAVPLLKKLQFPFTIFIAPERIQNKSPRYLTRKDLKKLRKLQLVSFGIHPSSFNDPPHNDITKIRSDLNNSVAFFRDAFGAQPTLLAFTHGVYSKVQMDILKNYNFDVLLGQQSGVAYDNKTGAVLPRFVMTENYADQNRFNMVTQSLPFPVKDAYPDTVVSKSNYPAIGFTNAYNLNTDKMSCYAQGQKKPRIESLNDRIEIRLNGEIQSSRFRVNCTLPVTDKQNNETKWRWHGFLFERP